MQKAIVLGANGYIGSNISKFLSGKGIRVIALVDGRFDYRNLVNIDNISCKEFNLDNLSDFPSDETYGADIIYHLAWEGVNAKYKNEVEVQAQNVIYGLNVLEFAKKNKIKRVLIPGSAAEVSCGDGIITGKEKPAPSDLYSAAKVATRFLCQTYALQNGIDLIWTLITSIYGPGRDSGDLISYTIKSLLKGEKPSYTNLEQQWDYIYIDDLLEALYLLGMNGVGGKIYPVGSGAHKIMLDYVLCIRDMIKPNACLGIGELPYKNPNKIDNQIMDISELMNDTNFKPKYDFVTGINKTILYFRKLL